MTRTRWTVLATGIAGPVGAILAALLLSRVADSGEGAMDGLAAAVGGLVIGGPILALLVFTILEVTLLRSRLPRPVFTWFAMAFGAFVGAVLTLLVLSIVGRLGIGSAVLGFALAIPALWFATAAYLAIRAGEQREAQP